MKIQLNFFLSLIYIMDYHKKYLKYKKKYENILQQYGGGDILEPGQLEISDPNQLDKLDNVSVLPMGYHTYYQGKDLYPEVKQSNRGSIQTFPNFDALKSQKSIGHSYTKIPNYEMTGPHISTSKYTSDKDCAATCSKSSLCNSFNVSKSGKNKLCVFHSNSSRFVPDNIHNSNSANYFEKTFHY